MPRCVNSPESLQEYRGCETQLDEYIDLFVAMCDFAWYFDEAFSLTHII